jgi:REP element-mobilizing transposase RayT
MLSPGTFFVTAVTARHRPIFRRESTASILIETLAHFRNLRRYWLHEFVVMPDHVHALITPAPGVSLERALEWVKEGFSRCIGARDRVWKPLSRSRLDGKWLGARPFERPLPQFCFGTSLLAGARFARTYFTSKWFDDTPVRDVEDYEIFRDHIRMNPVRSGLTDDARGYRHSSAYQSHAGRIPLDPMPAAFEAEHFIDASCGDGQLPRFCLAPRC